MGGRTDILLLKYGLEEKIKYDKANMGMMPAMPAYCLPHPDPFVRQSNVLRRGFQVTWDGALHKYA